MLDTLQLRHYHVVKFSGEDLRLVDEVEMIDQYTWVDGSVSAAVSVKFQGQEAASICFPDTVWNVVNP